MKAFLLFLLDLATSLGIRLVIAIVIFFIGAKLIKWISKFIKSSEKLSKLDPSLRSFLASFANIGLYILLVLTVASIIGIPMTSFIAVLATCGVAVGLALQGALSNFAGGLMLLLFKPFKVGDFVEAAGETGVVTDITVVYTILTTLDNKRITIPNGALTNSVIENYSYEELRRVDLTFNTAYSCDIETVKGIIAKVVDAHPMALKNPAPFVRLSAHGDSSLTYTVRIWCKNADYWDVNFDIIENVKKAFDENGIEIPYPQMDVHVVGKD